MNPFAIALSCAFLLTASSALAQVSFGGRPLGHTDAARLPSAPLVTMPAVDVEALMAEDAARIASGIKGPWRFGFNHLVDLGLDNSGTWTELSNGDRVWRLSIECPGAYSINFEFHDYVIPEGAQVFVYNELDEFLGSFNAESNPGHSSLGVTQLAGERITIEYIEPATVHGMGSLRVGQVTHAYRDVLKQMRGLGDSGACNNNVICPVGDPWRDQIRSVAIITVNGNGQCTGQLINNCANDSTPYFLTARHCLPSNNNINNWVYRFNWESPSCQLNANGPTNQTVSGSSLKVTSGLTDVALIELNSIPPASYNVFYTGWDRSATPPSSSTAIHHPSGDVKKISFDDHAAVAASYFGASTWRIINWENGTTEPGSSGSGLWNQNGLLVGQLFGGDASCTNNVNDYYGRFDESYPALSPWLGNCGSQLAGFPETIISVEEKERISLGIFPNPTSGITTILLPNAMAGNSMLRVHDATGRMIHSDLIRSGDPRVEMDLSYLTDGIYLLEVDGPGFRALERLVLAR